MTDKDKQQATLPPSVWEDEEGKEDTEQALADVTADLPSSDLYQYSNTKAENTLIKQPLQLILDLGEEGLGVNVAKRNDGDVIVPISLSIPDNVTLPAGYEYSLSQANIISTVGSHYDIIREQQQAQGLSYGIMITLEQLAGLRDGETVAKLNEKTKKELLADIEALASVRVTIEAEPHRQYNERSKRKSHDIQSKYTGSMLNVDVYQRGDETYLHIHRKPPLYEYAENAGQLITFNSRSLDLKHVYTVNEAGRVINKTKTAISNMTSQRRAIREFMNREIGRMRGTGLESSTITYQRLYDALSKDQSFTGDPNNKSTRQNINKNVTTVLDVFVEKGLIKSWDYDRKGRNSYYTFTLVIK